MESSTSAETSFNDLLEDGPLLDRLNELGFTTPTDIQSLAVPKIVEGRDVIVRAKTGSGKTLAFAIPLLQKLENLSSDTESTIALFIAPTRELAIQIQEVIGQLNASLAPVLIIGGVDEKKQVTALSKDARIIVGTPGRLLDLLKRRIFNLKQCKYFVLDEADEMLSMGFIEDIRAILSRLPKRRQGLFVSATITPRVEMLAHSFLSKAEYVHVEEDEEEAPSIEHLYCEVGGDLLSKPHTLCDIIETQRPRSAIIFCNTKSDTELVEVLLRRRGFDARRLNSDLSQAQRQRVLAKIKSEELQLLVATDIAARGIDIEQLDLVINYSLHDQSDTYIHRCGRTGRAGLSGRAISLVGPRDFGAFHHLTKVLDVEINKMPKPTDEEVADARLVHLYEMLRKNDDKVDPRALLAARKLLRDNGAEEIASDDLLEMLGRLCEFTIAHAVAQDAKSLDEELEAEGHAKEKRSSKHSDEESDERPKKSRSKRDKRSNTRENDEEREESPKKDSRGPKNNSDNERVRLYVGQGSSHGLSESSFNEIAQSLAAIDERQLFRISIREHYTYVDTTPESAERLIATVNGTTQNDQVMPVEVATRIPLPPRRQNSRRDSRSRQRGNSRRSSRR